MSDSDKSETNKQVPEAQLVSRTGELTSKTGINPVRQKRALRSLRRHPPEYRPSEKRHKKTTSTGGLKNGAGEGIRTLDINLGKVALYP